MTPVELVEHWRKLADDYDQGDATYRRCARELEQALIDEAYGRFVSLHPGFHK